MTADGRHIGDHYYPSIHAGWGGFAEELFHHTSRYYLATEAFLRNLVDDRRFSMSGYMAKSLSEDQRAVLAAVLAGGPDPERGAAVVAIVEAVRSGDATVTAGLLDRFPPVPARVVNAGAVEPYRRTSLPPGEVGPLEPFLSLAERLQMPVAVHDHHVEVSLHQLAGHLDAGNTTLRDNLQDAVIQLHEAGFVLRNHPHLTHAEVQSISAGD